MNKTKNAKEQFSRRRFAKAVAVSVAAAAPILSAMAQTPTPTPPKEPVAPPNPQASPTPQQQQPSPVVEAYAALAIARFGRRFSEEQMKELKSDIEGSVRSADRLKVAKLQNGEEPDFVFAA